MGRLFYGIALLFSFPMAFAEVKSNNWVCDFKDANRPWAQPDQLETSLTEPTVTEVRYTPQGDGKYTIARKDLITSAKVSSWKVDRSKCQVKGELSQGEFVDRYDFVFSCNSVRGTFILDFKTLTGYYGEELTPFNIQRNIVVENCMPK